MTQVFPKVTLIWIYEILVQIYKLGLLAHELYTIIDNPGSFQIMVLNHEKSVIIITKSSIFVLQK